MVNIFTIIDTDRDADPLSADKNGSIEKTIRADAAAEMKVIQDNRHHLSRDCSLIRLKLFLIMLMLGTCLTLSVHEVAISLSKAHRYTQNNSWKIP